MHLGLDNHHVNQHHKQVNKTPNLKKGNVIIELQSPNHSNTEMERYRSINKLVWIEDSPKCILNGLFDYWYYIVTVLEN